MISLRGASSREISRDALLEKVHLQRKLRDSARRAAAAALFIQRVWRRYYTLKMAALQLQKEWMCLANDSTITASCMSISTRFLRPFIFFTTHLSSCHMNFEPVDVESIKICLTILLESISSTDLTKNYCSLASVTDTRNTWICQMKKFISFCVRLLVYCDDSGRDADIVELTSLGIRLVVMLTDVKLWKGFSIKYKEEAGLAVRKLVHFMGSGRSNLYNSVQNYIERLPISHSSNMDDIVWSDDQLVIIASAITLILRPFHESNLDENDSASFLIPRAAEMFIVHTLTIPWMMSRLPSVLIPALWHESVLLAFFRTLMTSKKGIITSLSNMEQLKTPSCSVMVPPVSWVLANITFLFAKKCTAESGKSTNSLDYALYVNAIITLAENLICLVDSKISKRNGNPNFSYSNESIGQDDTISDGKLHVSYVDLLMPVCERWHLNALLMNMSRDDSEDGFRDKFPNPGPKPNLKLLDIVNFYFLMLRVFSEFNPSVGSFPVLNLLSFSPVFLPNLWNSIERSIFSEEVLTADENASTSKTSVEKRVEGSAKVKKWKTKDWSSKWASTVFKIVGMPQTKDSSADLIDNRPESCVVEDGEDSSDKWSTDIFSSGTSRVSGDILRMLHLFCATYSHLLLVLDDIEFYEKQVPFKLEQQRRISSVLNSLVYNYLSNGCFQDDRYFMDSSVRCLHLLYERDCRHGFCPPGLWLSPARASRPPAAAAAIINGDFLSKKVFGDVSLTPRMDSVIITCPHVFPFEERVQMFREFINMDKCSRRRAGEVDGPGQSSVEIVIRRGHIVEDGYRQLYPLGSRLKSSIKVSYVSECGLPEAGLDYGGLTKEFLTDVTKAGFDPGYGLFSHISTSNGCLMPNAAARFLDNSAEMMEFLGKMVGKALYEGILLDFSFSHIFVQKLLGRHSFIDELSAIDAELYKNLIFIKHYDGDIEELSLDFTITEESYGQRNTLELKPGGKDISVTNLNKLEYIHAVADFKLNRELLPFSNAFFIGLSDIISPSWLKLFNEAEFNQLLSGRKHDIDTDDLRNNTSYSGGYSEGSRTVRLFWEVISGFEPDERCMLLKFVTCCSRAPLLGFKYLHPTFTIHKVASDVPMWAAIGGQDVDRLPSASTCYNTLKLPNYKRAATLRSKLLYAINSNSGFELS